MTGGVDTVLEQFHVPVTFAKEAQVEGHGACLLASNATHIPLVTVATSHNDIFPYLSVKGDCLVPHCRDLCYELGALLLLLVVLRRIAEHVERRFEDHIHSELVAACSLADRIHVAWLVPGVVVVPHRTLCVVHRTGSHSDVWEGHVVGQLVGSNLRPFHLLQSVHAFVVEHVRIGPVESAWLVGSVEVNELVIFRSHRSRTGVEVHHHLVVTVHEVDLPSLDTHLSIVGAYLLHILVERPVSCPEHDSHIPLSGIVAELPDVDFRNHIEKVRLALDCPAFVENHILDSVLGGEVYIIFICIVVHADLEVHTCHMPVVPPLPGNLSRFHPRPVSLWICRLAEQPDKVIVQHFLVLGTHVHDSPRECYSSVICGDIVFTTLHLTLKIVVTALPDLLRIWSENSFERRVGITVIKIHSRIVHKG